METRVMVSRMSPFPFFLPRPDLLLLDEPCFNLDTASRRLVLRMLSRLLHDRVIETAIYSAHQPDDVPRGFDHVLTLDQSDPLG